MHKFKSLFVFLFILLFFTASFTNKAFAEDQNYDINQDQTIIDDNYDYITNYDDADDTDEPYDTNFIDDSTYYDDNQTDAPNITDTTNVITPPIQTQTNATKYVALTFDDGPSASLTPQILNALSTYNAKATFFLVGEMVANSPDIVKMIYNSGNEIGDHTYDHAQLTDLSPNEAQAEIQQTRDLIMSIIGKSPTLFRPPYGSHDQTVDSIASSYNLPVILWDVDTLDWEYPDVDYVYNNIASNLQDGSIILLHDIHPTSVQAAIKILQDYSNKGYQFVTVSQLASIKGTCLIPGQAYYDVP